MKKLAIGIVLLIGIALAYYLISPAFIVEELHEEIPVANPTFLPEDPEIKEEFMEEMKKVMHDEKEMAEPTLSVENMLSGSFTEAAHTVEGSASIIQSDATYLRFENFNTINGPNLHVYLSSDTSDNDFIDLGSLKATKGSFNMPIPEDIDLKKYNKVLIWCVPFSVIFSYAELI
jgi:hypothetical protein